MPDPQDDYRVANARAGLALYIPGKTLEQTMNDLRKQPAQTPDDLADQESRVDEMQIALRMSHDLFKAIEYGDLDPETVRATSYFARMGLECIVEGLAEQAVTFAMQQTGAVKTAQTEDAT